VFQSQMWKSTCIMCKIYTGCIDRIRALFGSLWYKDVRFYKNYNFFCKRLSLSASIHLWVCDDKAIFSWDMADFVHGVSSKVRPIGLQIEQKRLCTLCSKCYHGTHNDPRLLKFSTHILLLDSFAIKKFWFEYFPTGGRLVLNSYQSLFFPFWKTLLVC